MNDYQKIHAHLGHHIVAVHYGDRKQNVAIECEDCSEVLFDADK